MKIFSMWIISVANTCIEKCKEQNEKPERKLFHLHSLKSTSVQLWLHYRVQAPVKALYMYIGQ